MSDSDYIFVSTVDVRNRRVKKNFKKRFNVKETKERDKHVGMRNQQRFQENPEELKAEFDHVTEVYKALLLKRKERQEAMKKKLEIQEQDVRNYKISGKISNCTVKTDLRLTRNQLLTYLKSKYC